MKGSMDRGSMFCIRQFSRVPRLILGPQTVEIENLK